MFIQFSFAGMGFAIITHCLNERQAIRLTYMEINRKRNNEIGGVHNMFSVFELTRGKKILTGLSTVFLVRRQFMVGLILSIALACMGDLQKPVNEIDENQLMSGISFFQLPSGCLMVPEEKRPQQLDNREENPYEYIILEAARRYHIDPAMIKAIIFAESGFNARAVSKKGARGLMQLMPGTAKALGVNDSFHPEQNINAGVMYFKQLLERFEGDFKLALAAYNAGPKNVRKYKGIPPYKATRYYVEKVSRHYELYKNEMAKNDPITEKTI